MTQGARAQSAAISMRQDNLRTAVSGGAGFECLQVKQLDSIRTARPVQSPMISPHETRTFSLSIAGGGRGRRDCRRGAALQQFIDQPHTPHGASAFPSYSPSGGMDKPTQTQARLAEWCRERKVGASRGDDDQGKVLKVTEVSCLNHLPSAQPEA